MPGALSHCFFDRNNRSLNTRGLRLRFGLWFGFGRGTLNQFKQIDQLIVRQIAPLAQRNPAQADVHNARTLQFRHFITKVFTHTTDLTV